jgi:hypothetical protein
MSEPPWRIFMFFILLLVEPWIAPRCTFLRGLHCSSTLCCHCSQRRCRLRRGWRWRWQRDKRRLGEGKIMRIKDCCSRIWTRFASLYLRFGLTDLSTLFDTIYHYWQQVYNPSQNAITSSTHLWVIVRVANCVKRGSGCNFCSWDNETHKREWPHFRASGTMRHKKESTYILVNGTVRHQTGGRHMFCWWDSETQSGEWLHFRAAGTVRHKKESGCNFCWWDSAWTSEAKDEARRWQLQKSMKEWFPSKMYFQDPKKM